ncbi:MAG TPA: Imm27 family immunity protein [Albitalea sp.]|uniref:Imm27 family immunity protein n=1 Tax=Piscinibacter sp. TaxID=1903157 RepID=UPI002ED3C84E
MISPKILPTETQIIGNWIVERGQTKLDTEAERIEALVDGHLDEIAVSEDGWSRLFRDPNDGRWWELSYPHSGDHGGGPPNLRHVTQSDAARRFKI